jgi:hypothetical protein
MLPVFGGLRGSIFTKGPYTAGVLVTPGMHIIFHWGSLYSRCLGDSGDAYYISLGVPLLPVFGGLRGCIFH